MRLKVNSEKEYLELIHDLLVYGEHIPSGMEHRNPKYKPDADGLELFDQFDTLPTDIAQEYLGVTALPLEDRGEKTIVDENEEEWEETLDPLPCEFNSSTGEWTFIPAPLFLDPEARFEHPQESDYPIVIEWVWSDDFDRLGKIKTRMFDWFSLAALEESHSDGQTNFKRKALLWNERYKEKYQEFATYADKAREERNKIERSNVG